MSQQPTIRETIPFPYLLAIPNVYYWKKAFNHIVGTLYIAFDFLYFEGREATINPMIKVSSSSGSSLKNWSTSIIGSSNSEESTTATEDNSKVLSDKDLSIVVLYEHVGSIVRENYLLKPCLCIKTNREEAEKVKFQFIIRGCLQFN